MPLFKLVVVGTFSNAQGKSMDIELADFRDRMIRGFYATRVEEATDAVAACRQAQHRILSELGELGLDRDVHVAWETDSSVAIGPADASSAPNSGFSFFADD